MKKRVKKERTNRKRLLISLIIVFAFIILAWGLFSVLDKLAEEYYQEKFELTGELRASIRTAGSDDYCTDTCPSLGYGCGMQTICNQSINCGSCGENQYCNDNGICAIKLCGDSDGGINYTVMGTCRDYRGSRRYYPDVCSGGSLGEYYCNGNECTISGSGLLYNCTNEYWNSCVEGACVFSLTNNPPDFLENVCEDIDFDKNTNHTINMPSCFNDPEGDSLTFTYTNMSITNISIIRASDNLTLTPQTNFIGSGYFYINASDGINATQGRVDIDVEEPGDDDTGDDDTGDDDTGGCAAQSRNLTCGGWVCGTRKNNCNDSISCGNCTTGKTCVNGACVILPVITNSSPLESEINGSFSENLTFSISAENYDTIEWYVDGVLVGSGTSYVTSGLAVGNHEVKVVVKKGSQVTTKTWSLAIYEDEEKAEKKGIVMYFIIIFIILGALILVTVLLLIRNIFGKEEGEIKIKGLTQPELPKTETPKPVQKK